MTPANTATVVRVAVPVPLPGVFDYLPPKPGQGDGELPRPGQRVVVPFGGRKLVGVVTEAPATSDLPLARLQPLEAVLDEETPALTDELLSLLEWCARYYKHPLGEVISNALPPSLRRTDGRLPDPPIQWRLTEAGRAQLDEGPGRAPARFRVLEALAEGPRLPAALRDATGCSAAVLRTAEEAGVIQREPAGAGAFHPAAGPALKPEQAAAVEGIASSIDSFGCHLLDGITGSGKTEIYLQLAEQVLASGRQVLILVPEIGLTPQLLRRFSQRLDLEPVVSHSGIAAGERARAWAAALRGEARLFIGTRSALFLPLARPGLIVMDEAHDPSFKQQDGFRYAGADVAVKRAHALGIPIVLGTATPTLESLHNAHLGRFRHYRLRQRATGASTPAFRVIDLRQQPNPGGISPGALTAIGETLDREEQVLVFLNRRGYAPVLLCHDCGWHADCRNCDANLTWHRAWRRLHCHHCGDQQPAPRFCPACGADALQGAGEGTEQLERFLGKQFPDVPLHRVDRDRVRRKGELEAVVDAVRTGDPCVLVGTQMLAKGHHFPRVTLVVIVNLDQALYSADFRAMERMAQLLVQVAGRAGREQHPGTVLLQTHHPEHDGLRLLLREGYERYAEALLAERELADLPPFSHQATLRAEAADRDALQRFLREARAAWPGREGAVFGPFPAMMERRGGRLRWYLLLQTPERAELQQALDRFLPAVRALPSARKVRWTVDLDPQEF
ncbi:MAG: primosomal protein N' [Xanthomonadales bacterium]|jgi:primosomal protein N' (replication factor Y)|nr:primosomal protein N' [Xanthomonadales bacterium]